MYKMLKKTMQTLGIRFIKTEFVLSNCTSFITNWSEWFYKQGHSDRLHMACNLSLKEYKCTRLSTTLPSRNMYKKGSNKLQSYERIRYQFLFPVEIQA